MALMLIYPYDDRKRQTKSVLTFLEEERSFPLRNALFFFLLPSMFSVKLFFTLFFGLFLLCLSHTITEQLSFIISSPHAPCLMR